MGFLQNHAIKKSCMGLSRELLQFVELYLSNSFEYDGEDIQFAIFEALKTFALNAPAFTIICPNIELSNFENWKDLYYFIIIRGVLSDLSYDPNIGTREHKELITEIAYNELRSWIRKFS